MKLWEKVGDIGEIENIGIIIRSIILNINNRKAQKQLFCFIKL